MAKREPQDTDGITETKRETFRIDRPMSKADSAPIVAAMKQAKINSSFEAKIRPLEAALQEDEDLQEEAARTATPKYGSQSYYRQALRDTIATVRTHRSCGRIDAALAAAMSVGFIAAESWAKHGWPVVAFGVKLQATQQKKGQERGREISAHAKRRDRDIVKYVRRWEISDDLQDEYRTASAYVHAMMPELSLRTIQSRLAVIRQRK